VITKRVVALIDNISVFLVRSSFMRAPKAAHLSTVVFSAPHRLLHPRRWHHLAQTRRIPHNALHSFKAMLVEHPIPVGSKPSSIDNKEVPCNTFTVRRCRRSTPASTRDVVAFVGPPNTAIFIPIRLSSIPNLDTFAAMLWRSSSAGRF